ncbi:MAG: hypothetical protein MJ166_03470 [Clostridia bacterium]|nr:hypothetical protein [Clostridia bacterium]
MSNNSSQPSGGNNTVSLIVSIIILAALFMLFRYIWHGIIWAFNEYIELLKVK